MGRFSSALVEGVDFRCYAACHRDGLAAQATGSVYWAELATVSLRQRISSVQVVVAWAVLLVIFGTLVNKANYEDISVPEGTTGVELLLSISAIAISVLVAWKLHTIL